MPSSLITEELATEFALEQGTMSYAATKLAVTLVSTIAITSLLVKNQDQPDTGATNGGKVQLPPATDNKLPVVYGDAWVSPTITDVKISEDQQTMWYVLAFSETTDSGTINFDEVYWDDKILVFDPDNPSEIRGWFVPSASNDPSENVFVTGVAGKISMWFYNNGSNSLYTTHHCLSAGGVGSEQPTVNSAIAILQDSQIGAGNRWTGTDLMTNTVFAVVRVKYDSDHGVTGLGQIKARIKNSLKAPGDVVKDYLINDRYGAGIPITSIDTASLDALNDYSNDTLSIDGDSGTRYEINGIVDTGQDCLTNLVNITACADSWLQWNESIGKWSVVINKSLTEMGLNANTVQQVTMDNIIGGIQVNPLDLNSTYNSVKIQFPNTNIKDQTDYRYFSVPLNQRANNEPNNELTVTLPYCNNSLSATYIGFKRLYSSRSDIMVNWTMDHSGIQIDAGDVVAITHDWYGWSKKLFRVTQVKETKSQDGSLTAQLSAIAYNASDYSPGSHYYTPASFNQLGDPNYISQPGKPTVGNITTATATFIVDSTVPSQGNVATMEFWYSATTSTVSGNNFTLYTGQSFSDSSFYPPDSTESVRVNSFPTGTYYWRARAVGPNSASEFSDASDAFTWTIVSGTLSGTQIDDDSISGSKVISGDPAKTGTSQSNGFFDTLGKTATLALGLSSAWAMYKKYGKEMPKLWDGNGAGNDQGQQESIPNIWPAEDPSQAGIPVYRVGDTITLIGDATPPIGDLDDYANFDGYDVPPFDPGSGMGLSGEGPSYAVDAPQIKKV